MNTPSATRLSHGLSSTWRAVAVLLLLVGAALTVARAPLAHAGATPTIVQSVEVAQTNGNGGVTSPTLSLPSNVTSGDELVLVMAITGGNAYGLSTITGDNRTAGFFGQAYEADGLNDIVDIEAAHVTSSGSLSIGVGLACSGCGSTFLLYNIGLYEISGQDSRFNSMSPQLYLSDGSAGVTENGSGGTTHSTGTGLATSNLELDIAVYADGGANKTISFASGESSLGTNYSPSVGLECAQGSADAQSSFEFDTSGSAAYAALAAISIQSA